MIQQQKTACCSGHSHTCDSTADNLITGISINQTNKSKKPSQVYKIEGMDCTSCALTLEKKLRLLPEVHEVHVQFALGKMEIAHHTTSQHIVREVSRAGYRATLLSKQNQSVAEHSNDRQLLTTSVAGGFLLLGVVGSYLAVDSYITIMLLAAAMVCAGFKPARSAFFAIKSGLLDMNVLMTVAAIGASLIGEWQEGATVVWLFALGNLLQSRSMERTRGSIRTLMNLTPTEALVKMGEQEIRKPIDAIAVGEHVLVKPGEKIPLDGVIIAGSAAVNQAPITGESLPVDKSAGDTIFAGTLNENGLLEMKVTKTAEDTTIAKIIQLVEEAQDKKAPTQAFIDRFAAVYTPIVFLLALFVMVVPPLLANASWSEWFYKGLELLVIACPCALVISTPVAIVSAIGNAAKNGVLIKGGTYLEAAGETEVVVFDKTGTLTEGKPAVVEVVAAETSDEELLSIAYSIEEASTHPIAAAIIAYAKERNILHRTGEDHRTMAGKGAQITLDGTVYYAGNLRFFQELNVPLENLNLSSFPVRGNSLVVIGTAEKALGFLRIADSIRAQSINAVAGLKEAGVKQIVMLTGDNRETADKIASLAGVDTVIADLLPDEKGAAVKRLQQSGRKVAMVGDGINDAPALATADLGIAMGGVGTDTAMETANIVLMADNLEKLPYTISLSKQAKKIIAQNIWFSIVVKLLALVLIFPGWLTLWLAVISDTGAALVVILNSMRLAKVR